MSSMISSNSIENEAIKYSLNLNIKLLDNQFKEIFTFNKTITESGFIVRKDNEIEIRKKQPDIQRNEELLFRIKNGNNGIRIDNIVSKKNIIQKKELVEYLDNKLWMILNSDSSEDKLKSHYYLNEGDIIRFGKMKFIVHEIKISSDDSNRNISVSSENTEINQYDDINKNAEEIFYSVPEIEKSKKCKFCPCYNVCLCDCKPERLIHYQCLKDSIKNKIKEDNKNKIRSYTIENFICKHCLSQYPIKFTVPNNYSTYELISMNESKNSDYIILESYGYMNNKIVHLIILDEDKITIGKSKKNILVLNDSSVGDIHAQIIFDKDNKKLILESLNNNFDTSVLVRNSIKINEKIINLQEGKMKFEANLISIREYN